MLPWPGYSIGSVGLHVKLSPLHLSATYSGGFTLSFLLLKIKQGMFKAGLVPVFLVFDVTRPGI